MTHTKPSDPSPYGTLLTEQRNPRTVDIDRMSALELVDAINAEDRTVADAVHAVREDLARAVDLLVETFRRGGRLFYVGAGTSGRLGVVDASECPPTFGTDPRMVQGIIAGGMEAMFRSREFAEDQADVGARTLEEQGVTALDMVCGIAASGMTPFVLGALEQARRIGSSTLFVTCTPPEPHRHRADVVIAPLTGPEFITGSTRMKAGTATKLVLNTLTTAAMVRIGKTYENLMVDLQTWCRKLEDRAARILGEIAGASREEAEALLARCDGNLKVAIVMKRLGVGPEEAAAALSRAGGVARAAIESAGGDSGNRKGGPAG